MSRNQRQPLRHPDAAHPVARRLTAVLVLVFVCARIAATQLTDTQGPEVGKAAECGPEECAPYASPYASSAVIYDKNYFERYNLTTAVDMLYRVPGISGIVADGEVRWFGEFDRVSDRFYTMALRGSF